VGGRPLEYVHERADDGHQSTWRKKSPAPKTTGGGGRTRRAWARLTLHRTRHARRDTDAHDEVRAYKLARARKLVRRKSYPSKRILKAVAGLLARRLQDSISGSWRSEHCYFPNGSYGRRATGGLNQGVPDSRMVCGGTRRLQVRDPRFGIMHAAAEHDDRGPRVIARIWSRAS